jgi:hypothetical protein
LVLDEPPVLVLPGLTLPQVSETLLEVSNDEAFSKDDLKLVAWKSATTFRFRLLAEYSTVPMLPAISPSPSSVAVCISVTLVVDEFEASTE